MTAGMAFEALNQTGDTERDLLVVLNDNEMSIDKNVGALSSYFSRKISEPRFVNLKKNLEHFFRSIPPYGATILACSLGPSRMWPSWMGPFSCMF